LFLEIFGEVSAELYDCFFGENVVYGYASVKQGNCRSLRILVGSLVIRPFFNYWLF
jgi:hypothetical protein